MKKKRIDYINNQRFLEELIKHREKVKIARDQGKEDPILPDYIGECFQAIAQRFSRQSSYSSYTFREEMEWDAIEDCIRYYEAFDPEKGSNPFAYFTQVAKYAFWRRIEKEKFQLYVKYKSIEDFMINNTSSVDINSGAMQNEAFDINTDYMSNFIYEFEKKLEEKKAAKKLKAAKKGTTLDID